jgi:catechol 2,3-dioxygenase-like lactoylglutathione lyase family enzyme
MERVTGIGGIFFKAHDPGALSAWYRDHLGVPLGEDGSALFRWREPAPPGNDALTVWSAFPQETTYFGPGPSPFMINYRVADLDRMLEQLRQAGAVVDENVAEYDFGRFGWATDPEGNRFELWEPKGGDGEEPI